MNCYKIVSAFYLGIFKSFTNEAVTMLFVILLHSLICNVSIFSSVLDRVTLKIQFTF